MIGQVSRVLPQLSGIAIAIAVAVASAPAEAQQYNSDNYLSKPQGMATIILTAGERNSMWMTTLSLFPALGAHGGGLHLQQRQGPADRRRLLHVVLRQVHDLRERGEDRRPGRQGGHGTRARLLEQQRRRAQDAFQTYWTNAPLTLPLFENKVSWDIMPGASATRDYGPTGETAVSFTYATRVSWYPISPKAAIAGEIYGAEGEAIAIPEYRVGLRWEPDQYVVIALTYDHEINGDKGAGFEAGVMMFTPPFLCPGGCK